MSDNENHEDEDYEFARETLYDMICKGREGMEEMLELAKNLEHPRGYEVYSKLMKDTSDVANQLMTLHKQRKEVKQEETPKLGNTTNNVLVTTSTDLQRMLKNTDFKDIVNDISHDSSSS